MSEYSAVVERCPETKLYVGYVFGFFGCAFTRSTLDELRENLRDVVRMLLEDGDPRMEAVFVGTQADMG